jgi:hypothetical protein
MREAHYMKMRSQSEEEAGDFDRIGGLPTYLPPKFPTSLEFGTEYCFLMQILSMDRLGLKGWRCLQLYQSGEVDDGDDPAPVALLVPEDAPTNDHQLGRACDTLRPCRIDWEFRQDPDEFPRTAGVTDQLTSLLKSKLGGVPPAMNPPIDHARFLGQVAEEPFGFNFGGLLLTLWGAPDGRVLCVNI